MAGAGYRLFATGDVLTAAQVNTYLQQQTVMVFADSSARTTALSGVVAEGMVSYLQSDDTIYVYNGSAWISIANSGDITSVVAGNGLSGGATSGAATLTIDTAITVDKTTSQTLTNKTLTSPIISSISNTGTLTLPTSTDTLVGRATTDTLTNKTLTSPALTTPTISTLTTNGDLLYGTGSGALSRLGIGSSAQVLTVAGGVPSWATPAGGSGGMTLINSGGTTLSGSSVTVSSIPTTYKELRIIYVNLYTSSANPGQGFYMRFNSDSGSNYGRNGVFGQGGTVSELNTYATSEIYVNQRVPSSTTTLKLANGLIQIPSYTSTDNTCVYFQSIGNNNTDQSSSQGVGHYDGTAAITSISFHGDQTMGGGTVYVYGVS